MERKSGQCDVPGYAERMVVAASKTKELTDESGWFFFYVFGGFVFIYIADEKPSFYLV